MIMRSQQSFASLREIEMDCSEQWVDQLKRQQEVLLNGRVIERLEYVEVC